MNKVAPRVSNALLVRYCRSNPTSIPISESLIVRLLRYADGRSGLLTGLITRQTEFDSRIFAPKNSASLFIRLALICSRSSNGKTAAL